MRVVGLAGTARRFAVAGAAVVALAGVTAAAVPGAARQHRAEVPWRQAGPGWSVAEYSAASLPHTSPHPARARTALYLVSPQGRKYEFYHSPTATALPQFTLVDWSGDRRRVLVYPSDAGGGPLPVEQISLATGTVISRFHLPGEVLPDSYTRPAGQSLLADGFGSRSDLFRYSLTGHLQKNLGAPDGTGTLDAPDGAYIVEGTLSGLELISNSGRVTRRIRVPDRVYTCQPTRWWTSTTVLADCFGRSPYETDRMWLFPLRGGSPAPLTARRRPHGLFQGYVDAWKLPGGLYLQADNSHDTVSIVVQLRDGAQHTLHIPGSAGVGDWIVTSQAGRLLVESELPAGGPDSLFWYNPATRSIRFVFRPPPGRYGAFDAIPFDNPSR